MRKCFANSFPISIRNTLVSVNAVLVLSVLQMAVQSAAQSLPLPLNVKHGTMRDEDQEKRKDRDDRDPFDGEYIGNIWGWRISFIGLALIVVMGGLMVYRHYALGVPFGEPPPPGERTEAPADTLVREDTLR